MPAIPAAIAAVGAIVGSALANRGQSRAAEASLTANREALDFQREQAAAEEERLRRQDEIALQQFNAEQEQAAASWDAQNEILARYGINRPAYTRAEFTGAAGAGVPTAAQVPQGARVTGATAPGTSETAVPAETISPGLTPAAAPTAGRTLAEFLARRPTWQT